MEQRRFGRTGQLSAVAIFGAAAFWNVSQAVADGVMEQVINAGVNHIDVAPSYGEAEQRLGPWLLRDRARPPSERFFLGCKTMERSWTGAADEMRRSLERLQVDAFDLYQIHAVTNMAELDEATRPGGALDAIVAARAEGLTRYIGITGHGVDVPGVFLEALRRFDFDSVLFPLNFVQYANPAYRRDAEALVRQCRLRDVGTMIIKTVTRGPWHEKARTHTTWYEPFSQMSEIQTAVNFGLSQAITGLCTPGDVTLLPLVLQACEQFTPLATEDQEALIGTAAAYEPLFT
jgi:aryl-alcohol dehydrogenase-like predicted oxidoreductase